MDEVIALIRSFGHALRGICRGVATQRNLRIHFTALAVVIFAGNIAKLSTGHWCLVILCCMAVISLELINTSLEALCDRVTEDFDPKIKLAKDAAAGAVLISAAGAAAIALLLLFGENHYIDNIADTLRQRPWAFAVLAIIVLAGLLFVFLPTWFQKRKRK